MAAKLGLETLLASGTLAGRRVGIVCNPASVDAAYAHVTDRLAVSQAELTAIFGPQHGFRSDLQENMIETAHARDAERRVPVYSLYSDTREPDATMLEKVEVLVIDLQDVGTRIYTYSYTMANCLKAAARLGTKVIVCDRPNPIGGVAVEGPMLVPGFESFVGLYPIPMRHGMTIGELARLFNEHFGLSADLTGIPMDGWSRTMYHDAAGAPWVMPSPNIPTLESAVVYPGTVLFEGTSVSEGRGTTRPFELVGAPWLDPWKLAGDLNRFGLEGFLFRPCYFTPTFQKHAGVVCGGVEVHVTNRRKIDAFFAYLVLIEKARAQNRKKFAWRKPPYEYEWIKPPIDILCGTSDVREAIEAGRPVRKFRSEFASAARAFEVIRKPYLLY